MKVYHGSYIKIDKIDLSEIYDLLLSELKLQI